MKELFSWILLLLVVGAVFSFSAQEPNPFSLDIPEFEKPPKIDGVLDNPLWLRGAVIENFTQFEPEEGAPPSEKTVGYIGYDKDSLYIAIRCFDSQPDTIRGCLTQRDQTRGDDCVRIYLDTFNDKRRAFVFEVNPCGIQNDGVFVEARRMMGGRGGGGGGGGFEAYDRNWDTQFYAAASVGDKGYTVEIEIPFKSLRFPSTQAQTWGLQVMRTIKRTNEEVYWHPRTRSVNGFLAQIGEIRFGGHLVAGRNLEAIPVVTGAKQNAAGVQPEPGISLKYGITSDLTADLTYNPDFSQIEADMPQNDVNQRYALYFAEKRPFFLEGKDLFDTPFELVYTRKIVDPRLGFKLSGKVGKTAIGFLSALDENPPFIGFPNAPEGVFSEASNRSLTNIFRLRQDVFTESYLGFILTDKEMGTAYDSVFKNFNRVAGVDGSFKFLDFNRFAFQVLGSQSKVGRESTDIVPAASFAFSHQSRHLNLSAEWTSLPPDFEASSGFFRRIDINSLNTRASYAFLPQNDLLISVTPSLEYRRVYDFRGNLTDNEVNATLSFNGWRQSHFFMMYSSGLERYLDKNFNGQEIWLSFSSEPFPWLSGGLSGSFGDGIYYSEDPYLGYKANIGLRMTIRPFSNLRLSYNLQNNVFFKSRGGEKVYDINILSQRIGYQLSKPVSIRLITDYNDYYKKLYLSLLFSYELRPGTVFYLGIDENRFRENGMFRGGGTYYFVKFSYWWRL